MSWTNIIALALGVALLLASLVDVLWTTLGMGGGPILRRYGSLGWRLGLWVHHRTSLRRGVLTAYGVALLCSSLLLWTLMHWVGWTLITWSQPEILMTPDGAQASFAERLYFVGSTMATLGRGDLVIGSVWWKIVTIVMSLHSVFILTLVISFLLPVTQAATGKRTVARRLSLLGSTPTDVVKGALCTDGVHDLDHFLRLLMPDLLRLLEQHVTYPLLHFVHAPDRRKSLALRLAVLDEALTLLECGVRDRAGVNQALFDAVRDIIQDFLDTLGRVHLHGPPATPQLPGLEPLRAAGLDVRDDDEWRAATAQLSERRRRLHALVRGDGWEWSAVSESEGTEAQFSEATETDSDRRLR